MARLAALLLAMTACWRSPRPPPPLRSEPRSEEEAQPERTRWSGTCGDERSGWRERIAVKLTLRDDGASLAATGTLEFAGRRTKARLHGARTSESSARLHGAMVEIDGEGTRWGLVLELELDGSPAALRGRFIEVLDDGSGEEEMCQFWWTR
ncbi:MAG TPA: hypothetical protein VK932_03850 [Kofleriaceae bacterium]|nr:hypothetical protein [Kofleriaceae bacterium]